MILRTPSASAVRSFGCCYCSRRRRHPTTLALTILTVLVGLVVRRDVYTDAATTTTTVAPRPPVKVGKREATNDCHIIATVKCHTLCCKISIVYSPNLGKLRFITTPSSPCGRLNASKYEHIGHFQAFSRYHLDCGPYTREQSAWSFSVINYYASVAASELVANISRIINSGLNPI
jgi:hypothetical protein